MSIQPLHGETPPVYGTHHCAFRCRDAEETREFYEDVLGFPLAIALKIDEKDFEHEELIHYLHFFFDIGSHDPEQPNYIAFFEAFDKSDDDPEELFKKRDGLDLHFAMRVADHAALHAWEQRLTSKGIEIDGPIEHGICSSIYFYDPNGYQLEFTTEDDREKAIVNEHRSNAKVELQAWRDWKTARANGK